VALAAAIGGLLIRFPMAALLQDKVPYITFIAATAVSSTFGGTGPGLLTTGLGALFAWIFVVPSTGAFFPLDAADDLGLLLFLLISGFISVLAGRLLAARSNESALRLLFQQTLMSIGDGVISTDDGKRIRFMNRVAEELTGWREVDAKGKLMNEVFRIVHEDGDAPVEDPVDKVLLTRSVVGFANHTELIARDGRRIPIDDSAAPIQDLRGNIAGAVLVFRDVTERRKAQRKLEDAERRYRNILESITEAFLLLDENWRFAELNEPACRLMRRPAAELKGKVIWEEYPAIAGTNVEKQYRNAVAGRMPVHFEHRTERWDQWFEISAYPSDEGLAVYFRDITERKRNEVEMKRLNGDLQQFTFAATHDLREPLRMVLIYSELLQRDLGSKYGAQADEFIGYVVTGAQRISRLIDGLLEYLRTGEIEAPESVPIPAEDAFREALGDLEVSVSEARGTVTFDSLPNVAISRVHLRQLFQNLIANGLKYSRPGVPPNIHVCARREDGRWIFQVRDNGIGIAPQHYERIFQPFKRLHGSEVSGSGIGLATCKRIVERYGGRIWVESNGHHGCTFCFSLPDADRDSGIN